MRRKELEVTEKSQIEAILKKAQVARLALCEGGRPYIVPMAFGYAADTLYMHSAKEGKKIDMLLANPNVCFEVETDVEVIPAEKGCSWGIKYRSVIGFGRGRIVEDTEEKKRALAVIMAQYSDKEFTFTDKLAGSLAIIEVKIDSMTGKSRYGESL